jgi:hypothetical protein
MRLSGGGVDESVIGLRQPGHAAINRFKEERMKRKLVAAVSVAAMMALGSSGALAGEITGNGQLKTVHGNSPCAYSGQEDLQWYTDDSDSTPLENPVKGEPSRTQNWGQTKLATGLTGGANSVPLAEWGCNAHQYPLK